MALGPDFQPSWDLQLAQVKRRYRFIIVMLCLLNVVVLLVGGGWAYGRRNGWLGRRAAVQAAKEVIASATATVRPPPDVLEVNGEPMTLYDVDAELGWQHGTEAVHQLLVDMVVQQEASRLHMVLDDPADLLQLRRLSDRVLQPGLYRIEARHLQSNLLLRKMVLSQATDADRRRLFQQHRAALARYELLVSRTPMTRAHPGVRLGMWGATDIRRAFGLQAMRAVQGVAAGQPQPTTPFPSRRGPRYLSVRRELTGYAELLPLINEALVAERAPLLVRRLVQAARLTHPLVDEDHKLYPRHVAVQTAPDSASLKPIFAEPTASGSSDFFALPPATHNAHSVFAAPSGVPIGSESPGILALPPAIHPLPSASSHADRY